MYQNRSRRPGGSRPSRGAQPRYGNNNNRSNKSRQPKKDYIHPSKFIRAAKPQKMETYVPEYQFADFAINDLLKSNLTAMGFSNPSPIQDQTIPLGLAGADVVGIANTGTGKTAAFAVPMINRLMAEKGSKAIILAPTRELAQQIEQQCRDIGRKSGLFGAVLIGGAAMGPQLGDLRQKPQIVIGTPGRVKDHLERGSLDLSSFNIVVLDEVDRMLDMGFVHDIREILSHASSERQSYYFSATLDGRVTSIIKDFSPMAVHISVKSGETSDNVEQNVVQYHNHDHKLDQLHDILIHQDTAKAIIFDDTQRSVERLSNELVARGFVADAIHGGKTQGQRQRVLSKFKGNQIKVLVATDVAARGLDVSDITHVINYSLPQTYDDYVHRIGRAGRAGKTGYALTFIEK